MIPNNYVIYKEAGIQIAGNISGFDHLAQEIDLRSTSLYLSFYENKLIIGSLIRMKAGEGRQERIIFFQETPVIDKLNIVSEFSHFFHNINDTIDSQFQYKFIPTAIGNEPLSFQQCVENIDRNINSYNIKEDDILISLKLIIGKLVTSNETSQVIIRYDDFFTSIQYISSLVQYYPHILNGYSLAISELELSSPLGLQFCKNCSYSDYDIRTKELHFSSLQKKLYANFYNAYKSLKSGDLYQEELKSEIIQRVNLGDFSESDWKQIPKNSDINRIISEILRKKFANCFQISFFSGFDSLSDAEKNKMINNMEKSTPEDIFISKLWNFFRNDNEEKKYFKKKHGQEFIKEGKKKEEKMIYLKEIVVSLIIGGLLGFLLFILIVFIILPNLHNIPFPPINISSPNISPNITNHS